MNILSKVEEYLKAKKEFALVSVVEIVGSVPQIVGAKMIVFKDKSIEGTVGGGKVEKQAIDDAVGFIARRLKGLKEYALDKSAGMLCGGKMKLFFETFNPEKKLIITGGGHVGLALYQIALVLGFNIVVIDNRKEYANKKRFPRAVTKTGDYAKLLAKEPIDNNTYIAIATHGHIFDLIALRAVVSSKAKYIGMIGSQNKVREHFALLAKEGVSKKILQSIYAPIGLKLGGASPQEIALAILAQMQAVEYGVSNDLQFKKII